MADPVTNAEYFVDRKDFLKNGHKGAWHVDNGGGPKRFMFKCPCLSDGCEMITVFSVEVCGRSRPQVFDWNGSTATPTLEPWMSNGHWTGRLQGGIWFTHQSDGYAIQRNGFNG